MNVCKLLYPGYPSVSISLPVYSSQRSTNQPEILRCWLFSGNPVLPRLVRAPISMLSSMQGTRLPTRRGLRVPGNKELTCAIQFFVPKSFSHIRCLRLSMGTSSAGSR
jgi:hypothetical protein